MRSGYTFWAIGIATGVALALAACSAPGGSAAGGSAAGTTTPASRGAPGPDASSAAPSAAAVGVANTMDPCQLVTAAEASALAGATYGAGAADDTGQGGRRCTYGAQTKQVFWVQTGAAASASAAQADWAQEQSQVESVLEQGLPAGVHVTTASTDVSGLGDRAAVVTGTATISGVSIAVAALYMLKGPDLLAFGETAAGDAAPSASALQAQAQTSLARMP